jgi:hypothetical protein
MTVTCTCRTIPWSAKPLTRMSRSEIPSITQPVHGPGPPTLPTITYPYGWCVAADEVLTIQDSTHEEFLKIAKNEYTGEVIGAGDGSNLTPALTTVGQ